MEPEEVHSELGKLAQDSFITFQCPPIRALREIVEGLDAPHPEQGSSRLVEIGNAEAHPLFRDDVSLEIEADA